MKKVTLKAIAKDMDFELIAGEKGLCREVEEEMISRPGMEFAGFFDYFEAERIILVGSKEASYLNLLPDDIARERIEYIYKENPPAFVFSKNVIIKDVFIELGNKYEIPIFKSNMRTTPLSSKLYGYMQELLAEKMSVHGVLLDINGMGTLIMGKSGIGKSETALELIKRGHQLISDDRVEIFEKEVGVLIGSAPKAIEGFMEIRGIGIVNYTQMFGVGAFRENKKIRLVVELETWDKDKNYDRLGLTSLSHKFFNTEVVKVVIPVLPGRNVALLVESAALNIKLKYMGYNGAVEFTNKINDMAKGGK